MCREGAWVELAIKVSIGSFVRSRAPGFRNQKGDAFPDYSVASPLFSCGRYPTTVSRMYPHAVAGLKLHISAILTDDLYILIPCFFKKVLHDLPPFLRVITFYDYDYSRI